MTTAWIISDLHIDRGDPNIISTGHPDADVILMAGDLIDGDFDVIAWLQETFSAAELSRLVFVSGNHEYSRLGLGAGATRLRRIAEETGITVLAGGVTEIAGHRIVGTTLWSDLRRHLDDAIRGLAIPELTGDRWRKMHTDHVEWLRQTVQAGGIVVTHHGWCYDSLKTEMQHNIRLASVSTAYHTDLDDVAAELQPVLIVHGHTHITRRYEVAGIPIVSNAKGRGYPIAFDPCFTVELAAPVPKPSGF